MIHWYQFLKKCDTFPLINKIQEKKSQRLDVQPCKSVKLKENSDENTSGDNVTDEDQIVLSNDENNCSNNEDDEMHIKTTNHKQLSY